MFDSCETEVIGLPSGAEATPVEWFLGFLFWFIMFSLYAQNLGPEW